MKKTIQKILIATIIFILGLASLTYAANYEIVEAEYTDSYKQWLELSDEEKTKVLEPTKYKVTGSGQNNTTKSALLKNNKISLKNLVSVLKSSAVSSDEKYNIASVLNLTIKDQKSTNICWAFAAIDTLETNLGMKALNSGISKDNISYDYSERHMAYSTCGLSLDSTYKYAYGDCTISDGGTTTMSTTYLVNTTGAVSEVKMPFENNENELPLSSVSSIKAETTVNDLIWFDIIEKTSTALSTTEGTQELENLKVAMKQHLISYGSIECGIYMPSIGGSNGESGIDTHLFNFKNSSIYCGKDDGDILSKYCKEKYGVDNPTNHGVTIVGWDDSFPATNFATTPEGNGAWIIKNSYGTLDEYSFDEFKQKLVKSYKDDGNTTKAEEINNWTDEELVNYIKNTYPAYEIDSTNRKIILKIGDNGYFYVSYYDEYIYCDLSGVVDSDDEITYDRIYQLDELGAIGNAKYKADKTLDTYLANVFTREITETEKLTAVGYSSYTSENIDIYINPNGTDKTLSNLKLVASNVNITAGYHTIKLDTPCDLTGNNFVIVVKLNHNGNDYNYFAYEDAKAEGADGKLMVNDLAKSKANESYVTVTGATNDDQWQDFGAVPDSSGSVYGNFCIKGIIGKQEESEEQKSEDKTTINSNFDNANAELAGFGIEINSENAEIDQLYLTFNVSGIKPSGKADSLEYYYYLSSNKNEINIADGKWIKASGYEEQSDGTYKVTIKVTDSTQIEDVTGDSMYVYLKEIATKDKEEYVGISNAIEVNIPTDGNIESDEDTADNKTVVTYTVDTNNSNGYDTTTSIKSLPSTGKTATVIVLVVVLTIAIAFLIKYLKLKEI